jgi:hypothetical protein
VTCQHKHEMFGNQMLSMGFLQEQSRVLRPAAATSNFLQFDSIGLNALFAELNAPSELHTPDTERADEARDEQTRAPKAAVVQRGEC